MHGRVPALRAASASRDVGPLCCLPCAASACGAACSAHAGMQARRLSAARCAAQEEHRGRAQARLVQVPHPSQALVAELALGRFGGRVTTPWELVEAADRQQALADQQVPCLA